MEAISTTVPTVFPQRFLPVFPWGFSVLFEFPASSTGDSTGFSTGLGIERSVLNVLFKALFSPPFRVAFSTVFAESPFPTNRMTTTLGIRRCTPPPCARS